MKKIASLLIATALLLTLCACAGNPPKVQDVGIVLETPKPITVEPPAVQKPPTVSFQKRWTEALKKFLQTQTDSETTTNTNTTNADR